MPTVIGVKFKVASKSYYFDPMNIEFNEKDMVIVETARGVECGIVTIPNTEVSEKAIVPPLKPIIRKMSKEDFVVFKKNKELSDSAYKIAEPKILELNPEMKLVDVEYTFDQSKIIFYFTADGRVDFRELVRVLAGIFKKRIEMRQIDEREDFKIHGGLGICGRECCCASCLPNFDKVSIKMAKNQNLSLNPTKLSGLCGKLMCCLKFENEYYQETNKLMPKLGDRVKAEGSVGYVKGLNVLKRLITVKFEKKDGIEDKKYTIEEFAELEKSEYKAENKVENKSENDD